MAQGRGGTKCGRQTELSHIVGQNPRSFFCVVLSQQTCFTTPPSIYEPYINGRHFLFRNLD